MTAETFETGTEPKTGLDADDHPAQPSSSFREGGTVLPEMQDFRAVDAQMHKYDLSLFPLWVTSLESACKVATALSATHVISLLSPSLNDDEHFPCLVTPHHLQVEIDDTVDPGAEHAPTTESAAAIASFLTAWITERKEGDPALVVHCYAGVSRSSAVGVAAAWLLARHRHVTLAPLLSRMAYARTIMAPNMLLVSLLDEALAANGEVLSAAEKLKNYCMANMPGLGVTLSYQRTRRA